MLLFLCHDEKLTAELGVVFRIEDDFKIISKKFQNIVYDILSFPIQKSPMIDTFDYMFHYVESKLSQSEKAHYCSLIDDFENDYNTEYCFFDSTRSNNNFFGKGTKRD